MRTKIIVITMVFLIALTVVFSGVASAELRWRIYEVLEAGPSETGDVKILLYAPNTGRQKWCSVNSTAANTVLAVALTAMSTNMQVSAYVDFVAAEEDRIIQGMHCVK